MDERAIERFLNGEITFEELSEAIGRERATEVRAAADVLDRGEQLAEAMAEL